MSKQTCQQLYADGRAQRIANRPFDRISAYKVREFYRQALRTCSTLDAIAPYQRGGERAISTLLGCCTSDDIQLFLKRFPSNLSSQFGEDLIPAIEALGVEGIPTPAVQAFMVSIEPRVKQLIRDCDGIQTAASCSWMDERAQLTACAKVCDESLSIAGDAIQFCRNYGLL